MRIIETKMCRALRIVLAHGCPHSVWYLFTVTFVIVVIKLMARITRGSQTGMVVKITRGAYQKYSAFSKINLELPQDGVERWIRNLYL